MQIELRDGGGCIALFGLPFFICGLFAILIGLRILPMQRASEAPRLMSLLIGFLFSALGGALIFGRRTAVFDASQRRVIQSWSLLFPIRREERNLNEFTAVLIVLKSDSESADSYPVRLKARTGKDLAVYSSTKFMESRGLAEFLARFLHLDLEDRSTDHELVLKPERAGETLQEGLRSGHLQPERVLRPLAMRSRVDESNAQARLVIPERRWAILPFALGAVIPFGVALCLIPVSIGFFHRPDTTDTVQLVLLGCLIFIFGFLPLLGVIHLALSAIRSRTVITASGTGILIERQGVWRTRTTLIPVEDILALDYSSMDTLLASAARSVERDAMKEGKAVSDSSSVLRGSRLFTTVKNWVPSKGIIVKSRRGLFVFGEGLPGEELRYLQSIIVRALGNTG